MSRKDEAGPSAAPSMPMQMGEKKEAKKVEATGNMMLASEKMDCVS